jgi:toxin FitB
LTHYLLDANILSNIARPAPSETLLAWMADQADADLFIASLTLAEIRRGVLDKPAREKRDRLEARFSGPEVRRRYLPVASSHSTRKQV